MNFFETIVSIYYITDFLKAKNCPGSMSFMRLQSECHLDIWQAGGGLVSRWLPLMAEELMLAGGVGLSSLRDSVHRAS
jgi:hypothetical protein